MYVPFVCTECLSLGFESDYAKVLCEYKDDGLYKIECKQGHTFWGTFQSHLHEILFEIGAFAVLDGYYREAVASFASSLERFYEFYIKVVALSKKIPQDEFDEAWKLVAAQSERQFGAFVFVYCLVNQKRPQLETERYRKLRNEVIHKGKIPNKSTAIEYGNCVKNTIEDLTIELCRFDQSAVNELMRIYLSQMNKKTGVYCQSVVVSTIIGRSEAAIANWGRPSLEGHLERISNFRKSWLESGAKSGSKGSSPSLGFITGFITHVT